MPDKGPFGVLEIPPTLDPAQVKRAYFALLQRHAPHSDPEGFRRIRAAYEALSAPGALALAYATVPVEAAEELERWRRRWSAPMQQALARFSQGNASANAVEAFVETVSRMPLSDAVAAFRGTILEPKTPPG
ncbi:MAG TPA: hypothetical protein VMK12_19455 [Anaeromyxobacteraceae bacterium]|nr:hypothetical protein [Anaeromyxobacteraceae bacterium]